MHLCKLGLEAIFDLTSPSGSFSRGHREKGDIHVFQKFFLVPKLPFGNALSRNSCFVPSFPAGDHFNQSGLTRVNASTEITPGNGVFFVTTLHGIVGDISTFVASWPLDYCIFRRIEEARFQGVAKKEVRQEAFPKGSLGTKKKNWGNPRDSRCSSLGLEGWVFISFISFVSCVSFISLSTYSFQGVSEGVEMK
jgi:hypothetical protein